MHFATLIGFGASAINPYLAFNTIAGLKKEGRLDIHRPERVNMSHFAIRHPSIAEDRLRELTRGFQRRDYETHGPMALRFVRLRLAGKAPAGAVCAALPRR